MAVKETRPGIAVDSSGEGIVVDPTPNVLALVYAANLRQDDLRRAERQHVQSELVHVQTIAALMAAHSNEIAGLRAIHQEKLDIAESVRLNSIRSIDAAAVSTLAATTAANADNVRNALTATAATIAKQLTDTVAGIDNRISALERSSYEGKGKQGATDPMFAEALDELRSLREARASVSGRSAGSQAQWGYIALGIAIVGGLLGLFAMRQTAPIAPPQIYITQPSTLQPTTPVAPLPSK
jgi:hypothetical protein